jgi:purine-nucleoside phosphorylase
MSNNTPVMQQLEEAAAFIRQRCPSVPEIGIILGSGLGNFTETLEESLAIPYSEIPHFPVSTVEGHSGELVIGRLSGKMVAVLSGRFHFYEGYTPAQVVFPVRAMRMLGVHTLLISNAAGGMNRDFRVGDLMIIRDHISFFVVNPLLGKNEEALGTRFPDMSEPYDRALVQKAREIAAGAGIALQEGVYCGVTGPTFETRAEYRLLHIAGGDAVGMSTVQEVIAAVHAGMKVFAVSVITDLGIREEDNVITHQEVLEAAAAAEPKLSTLFTGLVGAL